MLLKQFIGLCLISVFPVFADGEEAVFEPPFKMRGAAHGNWWVLGEVVCFRAFAPDTGSGNIAARRKAAEYFQPAPIPFPVTGIRGVVKDSDERVVAEADVPLETFFRDGWRFTPENPGFYTVAFMMREANGTHRNRSPARRRRGARILWRGHP